MNRFVQELFTACNEDGTDFVLNDEGAYRCAKIIAVYRDLFCLKVTLLLTESCWMQFGILDKSIIKKKGRLYYEEI